VPPGIDGVDLAPEVSIPIDDIMLMHDSPVETADGDVIGDVDELITGADDKITHVLISEGTIYTEQKLIPIDWIAGFEDNRVRLAVDRQVIDRMPGYDSSAGG